MDKGLSTDRRPDKNPGDLGLNAVGKEEPMQSPLDGLRQEVGRTLSCSLPNPLEKQTIELLKEEGLDFSPYILSPQPNTRKEE